MPRFALHVDWPAREPIRFSPAMPHPYHEPDVKPPSNGEPNVSTWSMPQELGWSDPVEPVFLGGLEMYSAATFSSGTQSLACPPCLWQPEFVWVWMQIVDKLSAGRSFEVYEFVDDDIKIAADRRGDVVGIAGRRPDDRRILGKARLTVPLAELRVEVDRVAKYVRRRLEREYPGLASFEEWRDMWEARGKPEWSR